MSVTSVTVGSDQMDVEDLKSTDLPGATKFEVGDVVKLASGGPKMTVGHIREETVFEKKVTLAHCLFWNELDLEGVDVGVGVLVKCDE